MTEFRCEKCGKLLAKVDGGKVEIKCPRCKAINTRHPHSDKCKGLLHDMGDHWYCRVCGLMEHKNPKEG